MAIAALIVAIIAVIVSAASAEYTRRSTHAAQRSAAAAERSARTSEESIAIERARHHEERSPRLTAKIEGRGLWRTLTITLGSQEPLTGIDVTITSSASTPDEDAAIIISRDDEVNFQFSRPGVCPPPLGEPALRAYSYGPDTGHRADLNPHQPMTWSINATYQLEQVSLHVTCHQGRETWTIALNITV